MARVLAISSFLAHGRVGLGATVPLLQALGHEVIQLPTVILSNHPGHARVAGQPVPPSHLDAMLKALEANGWLADVAAVVTGYLPSPGHVGFAMEAVREVRNASPATLFICDPILGDDPKGLYIDAEAAVALRDGLVPIADVITPNRFELSWLTGRPVINPDDCHTAGRGLSGPSVVATSIPAGRDAHGRELIGNVMVGHGDSDCLSTARQSRVPHGTGDVFTALIAGHLISEGAGLGHAFALAHRQLERIVAGSTGAEHLDLSLLTSADKLT